MQLISLNSLNKKELLNPVLRICCGFNADPAFMSRRNRIRTSMIKNCKFAFEKTKSILLKKLAFFIPWPP
jgi:hypothetical protein